MHTAEELSAADFEYRRDGRVVARRDVLPPITLDDRVGVVMRSGADGLGSGNFLLACVIAFYDRLREEQAEVLDYPDYYTLQTTPDPADYRMLDVYPNHKNVRVRADPERLLRTINDRAITILLVQDGPTQTPTIAEVIQRSAARRVNRCYLYGPDGRLDDTEFSIRIPREPAEDWYEATAGSLSFGRREVEIVQQFRNISLKHALSRLPHRTEP